VSQVVRVIDVEELGQPALVVNTSGPKLLLLDAGLTCEQRINILKRFFNPVGESA
jgi:hypothetical protein